MNKPIEKGCLAEVISGSLGDKSPNKGLIVEVVSRCGDDPTYGAIWLCTGTEYVESWVAVAGDFASDKARENLAKMPPGQMHFAQSWLRRLPDPKPKAKEAPKELTHEH